MEFFKNYYERVLCFMYQLRHRRPEYLLIRSLFSLIMAERGFEAWGIHTSAKGH